MRIDAHAHWGRSVEPFIREIPQEDFIRRMDELEIDVSCVSSMPAVENRAEVARGNGEIDEWARRHPGRIIPYTVVAPGEASQAGLIKIHPTLHRAAPEAYGAFWPAAHDARAIILTHTWGGDAVAGPLLFVPFAKRYPKIAILLGHSGNSLEGCRESIEATRQAPNIYLELATSWVHLGMIERFVREIGADRVVFGTDMHFLEPAGAVGRLEAAQISDSERSAIFGGNMEALLGDRGLLRRASPAASARRGSRRGPRERRP